jgi:uncharacterized protein (TIGR02996 family)
MTDYEALYSACVASPDDNTPRLILADYIEELGGDAPDQWRAQAEWVRLAVREGRGGKRNAGKSTGRQIRWPGECAWLTANLYRLWPTLHEFAWTEGGEYPNGELWVKKTLLTGHIHLRLPWWEPDDVRPRGKRQVSCVVSIAAERGVTTNVSFSFLRAAKVAVLAARDCPQARLTMDVPDRAFETTYTTSHVYRRAFVLRGLVEVWNEIKGEMGTCCGEPAKLIHKRAEATTLSDMQRVADSRVDDALTKWARQRATNPLLV